MTEAESEEEAKRAAAATRDFKEAAARSKAAKDLRESAEAAKREADELEADAARMEAVRRRRRCPRIPPRRTKS